MKKIVFINQDSGYLMIDIVNAHVAKGYECVLITGRLVERNSKLSESVKVKRIIAYNRSSTFRRLFTWSFGFLQIFIISLFNYRNCDFFIVSNPPIAPLLAILIKGRFRLLIYDIYPEALSELGFIKKQGLIDKLWKRANKKIYNRSTQIYCLSEGMKTLLGNYRENSKIKVIPVWTDNSFFKPIDKQHNSFLNNLNIASKFIVLYSGNIGLTGNIDVLIDVALKLAAYEDIHFLIIGDGPKKSNMVHNATQMKLRNVQFLDWQPINVLPYSIASADIAVVSLGNKMSKLAIPSKTFNYLSVGAPILSIADEASELSALLTKYDCGVCYSPDKTDLMSEFILSLYHDKESHSRIAEHSLKASTDFDKRNAEYFIM